MIEPSRIICKVQHVRHAVRSDGGLVQQFLHQQVDLIIDTGAGLELAELTVTGELMAEGLLAALKDKVAEVDHLIIERFPDDIADA